MMNSSSYKAQKLQTRGYIKKITPIILNREFEALVSPLQTG